MRGSGDAVELITTRIQNLTSDAIRDRPAWTRLLGDPPRTGNRHEQWQQHIGIIAAYCDQYQITIDDPRQVLGPYPEPGHAGHAPQYRPPRCRHRDGR